jgi:hypothetical protein
MRAYFPAMLALILAGCASRDLWPVERVDPDTAVHLTIMAEPWIYALDDRRQAANASQFLTVTLVETNRTGTRGYWLNAVSSNTGMRGNDAGHATHRPIQVNLGWPTKQLQLASDADGRRAAGISEPAISVQGARIAEAWCPLSPAQAAEFRAGAPTAVSLVDEGAQVQAYVPWEVEDAAISEFLKATGAGTN